MNTIQKNVNYEIWLSETSRRGFEMLAEADEELRRLEAAIPTLTVAEFNNRKRAIEEKRDMLKRQLEMYA